MTTTEMAVQAGVADIIGRGPARVLVLHSWTQDSSIWHPIQGLVDRERFTYAFVDFPGYGVRIAAHPARGMDEMARSALDAADAMGWETFAVLGHSMGGAAALRVATLAPGRVTSLVALTPVSPGGTPLDDETYRAFRQMWPDCQGALQQVAPHLTDAQLQAMSRATAETTTRATWEAYLDSWIGADFVSSLVDYRGPALLVVGESDPLVTLSYLESVVQARGDTTVETLPGAGHYPTHEQSSRTVELFESALR